MTKRQVTKIVLDHKQPPYVPCSFGFTKEAADKLIAHYNNSGHQINSREELKICWQSSFEVGKRYRFFRRGGPNLVQDVLE